MGSLKDGISDWTKATGTTTYGPQGRLYLKTVELLRDVDLADHVAARRLAAWLAQEEPLTTEIVGLDGMFAATLAYVRRVADDMRGPASQSTWESKSLRPRDPDAGQCHSDDPRLFARDQDPESDPAGNPLRAGHVSVGAHFPSARPRRGGDAIASVQGVVAAGLLDTILIRDGRPIGDVRWHEISGLSAQNAREAAILDRIKDRAIPPDQTMPIREIIRERDLRAILEEVDHAAHNHA